MYAGMPIYLGWINIRVKGNATKLGFYSSVATLARLPSSLQTEASWFIQKQLEHFQMP